MRILSPKRKTSFRGENITIISEWQQKVPVVRPAFQYLTLPWSTTNKHFPYKIFVCQASNLAENRTLQDIEDLLF